jgi:hypothetical protein
MRLLLPPILPGARLPGWQKKVALVAAPTLLTSHCAASKKMAGRGRGGGGGGGYRG